jgi:hypothetical protein
MNKHAVFKAKLKLTLFQRVGIAWLSGEKTVFELGQISFQFLPPGSGMGLSYFLQNIFNEILEN